MPEDWNSILVDKELAELAIEELSQIDMNDSEDDSTDNVLRDVPATALNVLMNLSFDAVLYVCWKTFLFRVLCLSLFSYQHK